MYILYNFENNIKFLKLSINTSWARETVLYGLNDINNNNNDNFYTTDIIKLWNGTNSLIIFNDNINNKIPIFSYW